MDQIYTYGFTMDQIYVYGFTKYNTESTNIQLSGEIIGGNSFLHMWTPNQVCLGRGGQIGASKIAQDAFLKYEKIPITNRS